MGAISPEGRVLSSKVTTLLLISLFFVLFLAAADRPLICALSISLGRLTKGRCSDPSLRRRRRERACILGAHARVPLYPFPGNGPRHAEHGRSRQIGQSVLDTILSSMLTFYEALGAATAGGRAQWESRAQDYQFLRAIACVGL